MIKHFIAGCFMLLACACGANRKEVMQSVKDNDLLQEKTVNDYVFRLQYMPPGEISEDTALSYFRLNISNNAGVPQKGSGDMNFSYGLDTLFAVVNASDTIVPVDINRIANGTIDGTEYMLVFDKQALCSQEQCKLLFKDWLFTHQLISFPISGKVIAHIDSLSLKI